jgi:hypothetical protein
MQCVVGTLRGLSRLSEQAPDRQPEFDTLCGQVQAWIRTRVNRLRFHKPMSAVGGWSEGFPVPCLRGARVSLAYRPR